MVFVHLTLGLSLAAGVLTFAVGCIHLVEQFGEWCDAETQACFGPALVWPDESVSFTEDLNQKWRSVFTLRPDLFMTHWTPIVLGLVTIMSHVSPDSRWGLVCSSWSRVTLWFVFVGLFGNFGYAGSAGILVGFFSSLTATCAALIALQYKDAPTVFGWMPRMPNGFSGEGGGLVVSLAILGALVSGVLTLVIGFVTLVDRLPSPCSQSVGPCVGPGLFWATTEDFLEDKNGVAPGRWRSLFSLAPSALFENFTPFLFGLVACLIQVTSHFEALTSSWSRIWIYHVCQALFANFGYGGGLGIVCGLVSALVAGLALLLLFCQEKPSHTRAGVDLLAGLRAAYEPKAYTSRWAERNENAPRKAADALVAHSSSSADEP